MEAPAGPTTGKKYCKVIACEIAVREICLAAARSPSVLDLEFLTQGHHDHPATGRVEIQKRIDAVPGGKYDAILLGYGLCSSILTGLEARDTPLVLPRAHDCITLFLGSKERYQQAFTDRPGTYYYTSGWLECRQRRGGDLRAGFGGFLPAQSGAGMTEQYAEWVKRFGEEEAKYLAETMAGWTAHYTHGVLIDYDFTQPLRLREQVEEICAERGWQFEEIVGDLGLFQRWLDGVWNPEECLVVPPGRKVAATFDPLIIGLAPEEQRSGPNAVESGLGAQKE